MEPFSIKPGETVEGIGLDFASRLLSGETISSYEVECNITGVELSETVAMGTLITTTVKVEDNADLLETKFSIVFTATGSMGSVRKESYLIWIKLW